MRSVNLTLYCAALTALLLSACDNSDSPKQVEDSGAVLLFDAGDGLGGQGGAGGDPQTPRADGGPSDVCEGEGARDNPHCNPTPPEERLPQCSDGIDNDGDGLIDFPDDPGCADPLDDDEYNDPLLPQCNDGIDNDRDGLVDEQDPGCRSPNDNNEADDPEEPAACSDGLDNDGDGLIDFPSDPGCVAAGDDSEEDPERPPQCSDGIDNDGDGLIDYPDDPGCYGRGDNSEEDKPIPPECADGIDNDRDGRIDYPEDDGCYAASAPSERGPCGRTYDPPRLYSGETVVLDTSRGLFESVGSCGGRGSPELVVLYRVERDAEALIISTRSEHTTVPTTLYVRKEVCLDDAPRHEIACQRESLDPEVLGHELQINDVKAGDYYIVVDGVAGAGGPVGLTVTEVPLAQCRNGLDDDDDGRIDYPADPGCESPFDNDETDPQHLPQCANDEDDDGDGLIDYPLDPGCQAASAHTEADQCGPGVRYQEYFPEQPFVFTNTRLSEGATNALVGGCGGQNLPERAFLYRNPSPARLTVSTAHPETTPNTIVYVRRTCDARATELSCDTGQAAGTNNGRVTFEAQTGDYWIIVDTRAGLGGVVKLSVQREERAEEPEETP